MNPEITLATLAANRFELMQNSSKALNELRRLHSELDQISDEACILSLGLNDSIADMLYHADYARAIERSLHFIERFPHSHHPYFIARHLGMVGRCQALSGMHEAALRNLEQALKIGYELPESNENILLKADILHDLAMNNDIAQGDPKKSILYLGKALTILYDTTFENRKAICLMGLGNVRYNSEQKPKAALRYYSRAAAIFETQKNTLNLAAAYCNLGLCYSELNQTENALKYLNLALALRLQSDNNDVIANSYFNLSQFYDRHSDPDRAYANMMLCRDHAEKCANKKFYRDTLLWLESMAIKRNDIDHVRQLREERLLADQLLSA